jgi:membrane protein required for colicin V production
MLSVSLFNWLDWLFVGIIALSVLLSLWRGFVREAMSLLGWVAAFVIANLYSDLVARQLADTISNVSARHVAAYVIVFIAVLVAANLLSFLLKQVVWMTGLTVPDRILGTVFGFARGVLVILVLVLLARELLVPEDLQSVRESQLMPHLDYLVEWVGSVFGELDTGWVPGFAT